jgi:O-antigen ligase
MLSRIYFLIFLGSVILINPWGSIFFFTETGRAEIWTYPKIFGVLVIVLSNLIQLTRYRIQSNVRVPIFPGDRIWVGLWLCFIIAAGISTLRSPFPLHSLLGHPVLADGLLYWSLIAGFFISNVLVLRLFPELFKAQLTGLLIGGYIVGLSIIPQIFNWHIDYTLTSGKISDFDDQLLQSSIWQMQMPIGLYSNRGHASFVVASSICLSLAAIFKNWLNGCFWKYAAMLMVIPLLATQTLTSILACLVASIYFLWRQFNQEILQLLQIHRRLIIMLSIVCMATLITIAMQLVWSNQSRLGSISSSYYKFLESLTTGRLYLWFLSWQGIIEQPLSGWGFNGFGIAHLFTGDWSGRLNTYIPDGNQVIRILSIHEYTFDFLNQNNAIISAEVFSHKAHNLLLDLMLSVGLIGTLLYITLLGWAFSLLCQSRFWGLSVIVIVYLVFTQTWFESAQFSHLPWWCLSVGVAARPTKQNCLNLS